MSESSWILEVRGRLESPPPERRDTPGEAHAAFVPLYVDGGELWVLLSETDRALELDWGTVAFPGVGLESGQNPWEAVAQICAEATGADTERVLRLGELDTVDTLFGYSVVPCVGAIPRPESTAALAEIEAWPLPLSALGNAQLVEDRAVEVEGREGWIRVYHVGSKRIAGTAAEILEQLQRRLSTES